ncbi:MAG TPA: FAD-dependent oxidoreductase [Solirubrobacteraceae bacterium]|jgi:sulfide:quinone oxidoreductase
MTRESSPHVVVAGGGVAAVETILALRALAGPRPRVTLLAPDAVLEHRAASVGTPFGFGTPAGLPLEGLSRRCGFELRAGRIGRVDADRRVALDETGDEIAYDALVVAVGARPVAAVAGATTFAGPRDAPRVTAVLDRLATRPDPRLVFALPSGSGWGLPVYELAMMAAADLRDRGAAARLMVVTAEPSPLWVFGPEAGTAIAGLLADRGVALLAGVTALEALDGELVLAGREPVPADEVIALPRLEGSGVPGLPSDEHGFIPIDAYCRVAGAGDVFAIGDAASFPIKQGGLATQQADTVAEVLAARAGAPVSPRPFRPILRGLLLTGGAPVYLRSQLTAGGLPAPAGQSARRVARRPAAEVSARALWWPPGKVAGRYLAPLLATARPNLAGTETLDDRSQHGRRETADEGARDALELALLMADEDAAAGDFDRALQALEAASAMAGGILPGEYATRREQWRARAA